MLSYTKVIAEDPVRQGLLYVGTENAIYVSFDDGDNWQPLQNNLPHAPVSGIVIQEHFNDLVIGTYGRGFWILDDLSPIQQLTPEVVASDAHLFEPRATYRFREITRPSVPYDDPTTGQNPEYGASINYWLGAAAEKAPTIEILDATGTVIRTLEGANETGVNRIYWDLRDEPNDEIMLLTGVKYAPHIQVGPEGRPAPGGARISILRPPGEYTVRLTVDGEQQSQALTVLKDPNTAGSEADIAAQVAYLEEVRADVVRAGEAVERVEVLRVQLQNLARFGDDEEILAAVAELAQELENLQMIMVDLRLTGQGQDGVRFGAQLLQKLGYLTRNVSVADFPPTDQDVEAHQLLRERLAEHLSAVDELLADEVAALNALLRSKGMEIVGF
jgi:hypothetical protein